MKNYHVHTRIIVLTYFEDEVPIHNSDKEQRATASIAQKTTPAARQSRVT